MVAATRQQEKHHDADQEENKENAHACAAALQVAIPEGNAHWSPQALMSGSRFTNSFLKMMISLSPIFFPSR